MKVFLIAFAAACIFAPHPAHAYLGLGPTLPFLGGAIAFIFLVLSSILGIVLYPLKRLMEYFRKDKAPDNEGGGVDAD